MAKVTPVLWKHDPNPLGHLPIWLRFSDSRRTLYQSLGVYIHPRFWNDRKREVRKGHPNVDLINALVQKRLAQVEAERIRLLTEDEPITAAALKAVLRPSEAPGDYFAFADRSIDDLKRRGQVREHRREKAVLKKFREFTSEPLPFDRLTPRLLREYETHLIEHHQNKATTIAANFRVLKTLYNRAIREGLAAQESSPFFQFKPRKAKRGERPKLTLEQIQALESLELGEGGPGGSLLRRVRDLFLFSFYGAGIRFGDVAEMRRGNVDMPEDGSPARLSYTMSKTGKRQALLLLPQAVEIARPYLDHPDGKPKAPEAFLFPVLDGYDLSTESQRVNAIGSQNALANKYLKELARRAGEGKTKMPEKLTFHLARHSFADLARKAGINLYDVSKLLGHSGMNVTEHYLATLDPESMDRSLESLFAEEAP
ncbi:MAG: site-specific integrase [Bacteroidota bacterium]